MLWGRVCPSRSELPHDGVRARVDLDDAVVELIRDDDVAPVVEIGRHRFRRTQHRDRERAQQDDATPVAHE